MASPSPLVYFLQDVSDPLTRQYLAQNSHGTPEQRKQRKTEDIEAAKRSKEIDQWLRAEKSAQQKERRKQRVGRIILVGQSESGKSTTIKNFQLQYAPLSFWAERRTWKSVIHLNLVRSVRRIHDALSSLPLSELLTQDIPTYSPDTCRSVRAFGPTGRGEDFGVADGRYKREQKPTLSPKHQLLLMRLRPILDLDATLMHQLMYLDHSTRKSGINAADLFIPLPSSALSSPSRPSWWGNEVPDDPAPWSPASHTSILSSTIGISASQAPSVISPRSTTPNGSLLTLSGDEPHIYASLWSNHAQITSQPQPGGTLPNERPRAHSSVSQQTKSPMSVLSEAMGTTHDPSALIASVSRRTSYSSIGSRHSKQPTRSRRLSLATLSLPPSTINVSEWPWSRTTLNQSLFGAGRTAMGLGDGATSTTDRIMAACAPDIAELWKDPTIRNILGEFFGIQVECEAGFFLDDVDRVTALGYEPTDDDILKARLKTQGVSEYRFILDSELTKSISHINEIIIYDVGGSRTRRHEWMNYFEDVDSLIFLAPVSAYDQCLAEDPTVNRVQDTLNLWKSVCSSPLLKKVDFILFLNKCDLLESKLRKRISFKKYVSSYKGPETFEGVIHFFKATFIATWRRANETLKVAHGRTLHIHRTTVVDSRATRKLLNDVRDAVARSYMRGIAVL